MHRNHFSDILVVCTANRCRSPLAESLLVTRVGALGLGWTIDSAGTHAQPGEVTEPEVVEVLGELGVPATAHPVRRLDPAGIEGAQLVLTAERAHRSTVLQIAPAMVSRAFTLLEFERLLEAAGPQRVGTTAQLAELADSARSVAGPAGAADDLADPVGQPIAAFRDCRTTLQRVIERIMSHVATPGPHE